MLFIGVASVLTLDPLDARAGPLLFRFTENLLTSSGAFAHKLPSVGGDAKYNWL